MNDGNSREAKELEAGDRAPRVEGELRIPEAGRLRDALLAALEPGGATVLDVSGVSDADLGGLQLLCSAHRTYRRRGARFELRGISEPLRLAARAAGFETRSMVCPHRVGDDCLWKP